MLNLNLPQGQNQTPTVKQSDSQGQAGQAGQEPQGQGLPELPLTNLLNHIQEQKQALQGSWDKIWTLLK